MHTLDTNAIIYYLNEDKEAYSKVREIMSSEVIYVSTISEIELLSFSKLTENDKREIGKILSTLFIIPVDSRVGAIAADIRRETAMKLADSIIAATAMFTNSTLLTRNIKDFKKIAGLRVRKI